MDIDREVKQCTPTAQERIKFCLDRLEDAGGFAVGINWDTSIAAGLGIEEILGALVSAEQYIKNVDKE